MMDFYEDDGVEMVVGYGMVEILKARNYY